MPADASLPGAQHSISPRSILGCGDSVFSDAYRSRRKAKGIIPAYIAVKAVQLREFNRVTRAHDYLVSGKKIAMWWHIFIIVLGQSAAAARDFREVCASSDSLIYRG